MKNILRSGAILAMVLGLGACGGKADELIGEMKKASDAMCACKDKACVEKVQGDLEKTMEKHKDTKGTAAQAKALEPIMKKLMECSMKAAMGADAPAPTPPAGG